MNSSIKSNKSLRRNKEGYSRFLKKSDFSDCKFYPLSKEENLLIVKENKRIFKRKTRNKNLFGVFIVLLYLSIIIYGLKVFFI